MFLCKSGFNMPYIMFIEKTEICNFADDNTIYDCGEDLSNILENLKHDLKTLLKWFKVIQVNFNS